jgi:1,4-dihydroxy-2-naphthoyl-CoA hydrolase
MTDAPPPAAEDAADMLNASADGWNEAMGLRFVRATADEVVAELEVGPAHRQPYGIVHGGVHAGIIETATSVGAALYALKAGRSVVGLENHTSFFKAVREGKLRVTARPLTRGRSTQVWEGTVTDAHGVAVASGRVRLFSLDPGAPIAGQKVDITPG